MGGTREALIVATGVHEDQSLRRLRAPAQDAAALSEVLADPAIGDFHVKQVIDQPAHIVSRAIQQFFAKRSLDDLLLMHLSCHGVKDDDGRLYFAATNTEKDWLASTAVSAAFVNDLMERCRARSIILLLDCCYSGAFVPGSKGDEGVHLKEKFLGRGRAVLTASNAIEYAWEGDELSGEGQPSLFTAAIVEGLYTGEADRDRDGAVSIGDLYTHVCERVDQAKRGQTPLMWALEIERNLYIAHNPYPPSIEPLASRSGSATGEAGRLDRADQGQVTERFIRAIDQLGHSELPVRLGGIYSLDRIANISPDDRDAIADVLTAFLRVRSPWPSRLEGQPSSDTPIDQVPVLRDRAPDVQAALTVLTRRPIQGRLHLHAADLRKASLERAYLQGCDLAGTNLHEARLIGADLQRADLRGANLQGADLQGADLQGRTSPAPTSKGRILTVPACSGRT